MNLATAATGRLGVDPFAVTTVYAGQVCGPLAVSLSPSAAQGGEDTAQIAFMGAKCQNVRSVCDTSCSFGVF